MRIGLVLFTILVLSSAGCGNNDYTAKNPRSSSERTASGYDESTFAVEFGPAPESGVMEILPWDSSSRSPEKTMLSIDSCRALRANLYSVQDSLIMNVIDSLTLCEGDYRVSFTHATFGSGVYFVDFYEPNGDFRARVMTILIK